MTVRGAMNLLGKTAALLMLVLTTTSVHAVPNETILDDPLAPARSGLAECTSPDEQAHTCHALTRTVFVIHRIHLHSNGRLKRTSLYRHVKIFAAALFAAPTY